MTSQFVNPSKPDDSLPIRAIANIGVVGAGTMGGAIAMNFLNIGLPVVLLEATPTALERGIRTIRNNYEASVKKGRLSATQAQHCLALLKPTLDYAALADADLVIEAVFEQMQVKEQVFRQLDVHCKRGAILASNTSYLDINQIAAFTSRPEQVLGLHFFSPAHIMKLLEIVRGDRTRRAVIETALALAGKINKVAVVAGVCDGFIGNRMLARYVTAAYGLIHAGATPQQVDEALQAFGFAMGPLRVGDLAGLDIGWATRQRKAAQAGKAFDPVVADKLCELGRFGQKTGAGWYAYQAGSRTPLADPLVDQIIAEYRRAKNISARPISAQEVVERCVYALVNEGARILAEGIAQSAADIDLVYLHGYGFARQHGGPMRYADSVGLARVVSALRRLAAEPAADPSWQPAALLVRLAERGQSFHASAGVAPAQSALPADTLRAA